MNTIIKLTVILHFNNGEIKVKTCTKENLKRYLKFINEILYFIEKKEIDKIEILPTREEK